MLITEYMRAMGLLDSARILYAILPIYFSHFSSTSPKHLQIMAYQYISHLSSCLGRCGPHMEIPYLRRNKCGPHSCHPSSAGISSCQLVILRFCSFWEKPSFGRCSFDILGIGLCHHWPRHKVISNRLPLRIFYSLPAVLLCFCC